MDSGRLFGGNPLGVIVRLIVLSIVVGIILSALDITPANIIYRVQNLIRRISELGFGIFEGAFQYFLLGVVVVVPIWLIARLLSGFSRRDEGPRP